MEMGLVPGVSVQVLRKAPLGDPVQYRVRGAVISMRAAEAASVTVCGDMAGYEADLVAQHSVNANTAMLAAG